MVLAKVLSGTLLGVDAHPVEVEVDLAMGPAGVYHGRAARRRGAGEPRAGEGGDGQQRL